MLKRNSVLMCPASKKGNNAALSFLKFTTAGAICGGGAGMLTSAIYVWMRFMNLLMEMPSRNAKENREALSREFNTAGSMIFYGMLYGASIGAMPITFPAYSIFSFAKNYSDPKPPLNAYPRQTLRK